MDRTDGAPGQPGDNTTGTIAVTAPDLPTDDEVLVWVYDGKTKTIMSSLNFVTGEITVASNAYSLPRAAGSQEVKVETNIDYVVDIPDDAQSWLSVSSTRSAMRTDTLTFHLTENKGFARQTVVSLKNNAGKTLQTIALKQAGGALSVHVILATFNTSYRGTETKHRNAYTYRRLKQRRL